MSTERVRILSACCGREGGVSSSAVLPKQAAAILSTVHTARSCRPVPKYTRRVHDKEDNSSCVWAVNNADEDTLFLRQPTEIICTFSEDVPYAPRIISRPGQGCQKTGMGEIRHQQAGPLRGRDSMVHL